jgi:hypothetical protein
MSGTVRSLARGTSNGTLYAGNDVALEILAIGGGGGGAGSASIYSGSGGGGAGGVINKEVIFPVGSFTIVIGAGGTGGPSSGSQRGSVPGATTIVGPKVDLYAYYGGVGGAGATEGGEFGGSAGGGDIHIPASWTANGSVPGQGNGQTEPRQKRGNAGNGGGGASSSGTFGVDHNGQAGFGGHGIGHLHTWAVATSTGVAGGFGQAVNNRRYYAGGGGGGHSVYYGAPYNQNNAGLGGGGYGAGNSQAGTTLNAGTAGTANTGSGGGGGGANGTTFTVGYAGGSGIVIIRYLTGAITATGGTIVTSGGYTYHTFTSNGTFTRTA